MKKIEMCDLTSQYMRLKAEIDAAISGVMASSRFIKGDNVAQLEAELCTYLGSRNCITVGNGTDALFISLISLGLPQGSEVITPSFTFVATAEVILRAGLTPVYVDVDRDTFLITPEIISSAISEHTRAIMAVHLFGQAADMSRLREIADERGIVLIEDACQAIGARCMLENKEGRACAMGHIGCTSFFPSKNLGCAGDGGAIFTDDDALAAKIRSIANHGMAERYHYQYVGVNSRLDAIQAAILRVKLTQLDDFIGRRKRVAAAYIERLADLSDCLILPQTREGSEHTYNQFTLRVLGGKRDSLKAFLQNEGIPTMIYYPLSIHTQAAYSSATHRISGELHTTQALTAEVLSLPIHTEMDDDQITYVCSKLHQFFRK